jgi:putative ABC transport system substrate-binding protein
MKETLRAAGVRGVRLLIVKASGPSEFEAAFATLTLQQASGLAVAAGPLYSRYIDQLAALEAHHRIPTIYSDRKHTVAGGLMNYGTDLPDTRRQLGIYIGRILKGEKPADLPVQQVTKMQLTINMKTAKALGVSFPLTLLGRADEVIE